MQLNAKWPFIVRHKKIKRQITDGTAPRPRQTRTRSACRAVAHFQHFPGRGRIHNNFTINIMCLKTNSRFILMKIYYFFFFLLISGGDPVPLDHPRNTPLDCHGNDSRPFQKLSRRPSEVKGHELPPYPLPVRVGTEISPGCMSRTGG